MAITAKHLSLQVQKKPTQQAKQHRILKWRNMSNIQRNEDKEITQKTSVTQNRRGRTVKV